MHRDASAKLHPSLINKIETVRNFSEHRKRLNTNRAASASDLTKGISFDRNKAVLYEHIKQRRQYTSDYKRREELKQHETNDTKMIYKMLDYQKKNFVFNPTASPPSDTLLHHNSITSLIRKNQKIQEENELINFRINKVKSMYNQKLLSKRARSSCKSHVSIKKVVDVANSPSLKINKFDKFKVAEGQRNVKGQVRTEMNLFLQKRQSPRRVVSEQEILGKGMNFNLVETFPSSKGQQMSTKGKIEISVRKHLCARIQSEKLAEKLFAKKQKRQKLIPSRLGINN